MACRALAASIPQFRSSIGVAPVSKDGGSMRARRSCAHSRLSRTPKSRQVPRRPANATANISRRVSHGMRAYVGEIVEVAGTDLAPHAAEVVREPHHVCELLHERSEQPEQPAA